MGITRLMNLLREKAKRSVRTVNLSTYIGQVFALDASMAMYQFLISTQSVKSGFSISELRDDQGNLTGHLLGLINRSVYLMEHGIKPVWVFDGKPPEAKINVLRNRKQRKQEAIKNEEEAKDKGEMDKALKYAGQHIQITPQMTADAKKLITLMGIPMIEAPSEAEASCSILAKSRKANAAATEDMDCLCFGCPILIRELTNKEETITEVNLAIALEELNLTMDQFIDLCILCGCDYCSRIEGIGTVNALKLIQEHKSIEGVLDYVEKYNKDPSHKKKLSYDKDLFNYQEARRLFKEPEVVDSEKTELNWTKPKADELKAFLVNEKGFNETRISNLLERIDKAKSKSNQTRMDSFLNFVSTQPNPNPKKVTGKVKGGVSMKEAYFAQEKGKKKGGKKK